MLCRQRETFDLQLIGKVFGSTMINHETGTDPQPLVKRYILFSEVSREVRNWLKHPYRAFVSDPEVGFLRHRSPLCFVRPSFRRCLAALLAPGERDRLNAEGRLSPRRRAPPKSVGCLISAFSNSRTMAPIRAFAHARATSLHASGWPRVEVRKIKNFRVDRSSQTVPHRVAIDENRLYRSDWFAQTRATRVNAVMIIHSLFQRFEAYEFFFGLHPRKAPNSWRSQTSSESRAVSARSNVDHSNVHSATNGGADILLKLGHLAGETENA